MSSFPDILRYSEDSEPGIYRRKIGDDFEYLDGLDKSIICSKTIKRITALGIPPAYSDVWICADAFGHIQATGRDIKNRKQYRYHSSWREFKDRKKFESLIHFAEQLPKLRRRVRRDLAKRDNSKAFVCAAIIRLIDAGALRVGNDRNDAFGASNLRGRHIKFHEGALKLDYKAKGGKRIRKTIKDRTLSQVLQYVDDLPGRRVFQYIDSLGHVRSLDSAHVNDYIGTDFTAKTFRTWHGSVAAYAYAFKSSERPTIKSMCEAAAKRLHNTPEICRSSYIHPSIISLTETDAPFESKDVNIRGLRKSERQLLAFLKANEESN